jgi:predicted amidohydrolase YtcJ
MWTRDAAAVLQWPEIGSIRPGTNADLVVVDRDLMSCDVEDIGDAKALLTLVDGRIVHDAKAL